MKLFLPIIISFIFAFVIYLVEYIYKYKTKEKLPHLTILDLAIKSCFIFLILVVVEASYGLVDKDNLQSLLFNTYPENPNSFSLIHEKLLIFLVNVT